MNNKWDFVFETYAKKIQSPDGRDTFESSDVLIDRIITNGEIKKSDTIIDIGSGWGNVAIKLSELAENIVGIEPNDKNLEEAEKRIRSNGITNIELIKGSFEVPNYHNCADKIISSLVLHQIALNNKKEALSNIKKLLGKNGIFVLCDTIILFDPIKEKELFNKTYRYLIEKTTPTKTYESSIKKYFEDNAYVYSWEDMKKYTPEKYWYYSLSDLQSILNDLAMKIIKIDEICPFFGILSITNQ